MTRPPVCDYDDCDEASDFRAFACYDHPAIAELEVAHPLVARYPMPMIRACWLHLSRLMFRDMGAPGTTARWVVEATHANVLVEHR